MVEKAKTRFDGGSLDCGSGLLLLIRKHIDPLQAGEFLEFTSTDSSVEVDLPSWCNLTGNPLVSCSRNEEVRTFLIRKGGGEKRSEGEALPSDTPGTMRSLQSSAETKRPLLSIPHGAVLGIGSWPRPGWMLRAIHDHLEGRLGDSELELTARDAVKLSVEAQVRAGVDVVTDGEQRRDSYASFVGSKIENCQLIPLLDVLAYVDDPGEFQRELQSLDIPAGKVRHPMVFGKLKRTSPLALREATYLHQLTDKPTKIALPGPYLLTRMMWMDCVVDRAYQDREALAADVVTILRQEVRDLLDEGVSIVQLDEPILTEVVFGQGQKRRSFMCGILGEKKTREAELGFAGELIQSVVSHFPRDRLALHMCRGNWSPDEAHAIAGSYGPLIPTLNKLDVGTLLLEMATERAGGLDALKLIRSDFRLGIGVANQKRPDEGIDLIRNRVSAARKTFGNERLLFTPDCGFATFADNPIDTADQAERILRNIVSAVSETS